ncbi:hypothetical protein [Burkholderia ubonensis]|uniref:hypothetical protein n=1 Tax=Burkholderia ubonensis TaxID=101571 RepID=UPI0008FDDDFD|nr:hypothetical protein [Burkholderia ubonensis]OJB35390.1 hypothetical protein BGV48_00240 [Burkholderia ubonensis]
MRALSLHRPVADNALLHAAARGPRVRYVIEGAVWAMAFGAVVGALWFSVDLAGPYLRSLG